MCRSVHCPHKDPVLGPIIAEKSAAKLRGRSLSAEHRAKLSTSLKGNKNGVGNQNARGHIVDEEARKLMGVANMGRRHTKEWKTMMHEKMRGFHHSDEARRKISESRKGKFAGQTPWNKGKPLSDETKRKLSESKKGSTPWNKGKPMSPESRKKLSLKLLQVRKVQPSWNKGKPLSEEHKQKLRGPRGISEESRRRMRQHRLSQVFPNKDTKPEVSLQQALAKLGIVFIKHKAIDNYVQCDIFIEPNIVVFVDGCYWHSCPFCGFGEAKSASQQQTRKRDGVVNAFFASMSDYEVIRIWEHAIKSDVFNAIQPILDLRETMYEVEGY